MPPYMTKSDDDIIATAKERFAYALERSSHNRDRAREDIRFAAASPDDPWQWEKATIQNNTRRQPRWSPSSRFLGASGAD